MRGDFSLIVDLLNPAYWTLENLVLLYAGNWTSSMYLFKAFLSVGTLRCFAHLRVLHIPYNGLLQNQWLAGGYDTTQPSVDSILPRGLEELHIEQPQTETASILDDLDRSADRLPNLRIVHLLYFVDENERSGFDPDQQFQGYKFRFSLRFSISYERCISGSDISSDDEW
ncbi:hypothetical protein K491DRAFT_80537 [Lophiostoma macrostomum CBS 122681]|uniref:Leucine-rich repeat domain-containing protein n=1 Tax=Lophiostoma macrostomum CBS 122681 TaxID=1314788 RepID=A0A6A6TME4_9PLEO|nr:hypothetical protein K491DRAFT_80537 [Lophiostoma macrostomum CBS 122681]